MAKIGYSPFPQDFHLTFLDMLRNQSQAQQIGSRSSQPGQSRAIETVGDDRGRAIDENLFAIHGSLFQALCFWDHLKKTRAILTQAGERVKGLRQTLYKEILKDGNINDDVVNIILEDLKKRNPQPKPAEPIRTKLPFVNPPINGAPTFFIT